MSKPRLRVPVPLLVIAAGLLVLGLIATQVVPRVFSEQALIDNVLLGAIPFILIFVAIILTFIGVIAMVASVLSGAVAPRPYRLVETALIAGIVFGIVGMFQPWLFILYKVGFLVLLVSTLGFILWSHVAPQTARRTEN